MNPDDEEGLDEVGLSDQHEVGARRGAMTIRYAQGNGLEEGAEVLERSIIRP
jgi:hypothetical protein